MHKIAAVLPALILLFALAPGCPPDDPDDPDDPDPGNPPTEVWEPGLGLSFDWVLDDDPPMNSPADVIDVDAFDVTAAQVTALKAQGKHVIAYLSVGTVENWRPDADDFPNAVVGNPYDGWEGERWLDIGNIDALAEVLTARLDMIAAKGFDAVEPDNIDGFEGGDTGFDITAEDTVAFCLWLAEEAHARKLSIGQKNAPELAPDLVDTFDWMLTEDAFADGWYEDAAVYTDAGKAVFATEYTDTDVDFEAACDLAESLGFTLILKDRDLTQYIMNCP